MLACGENASDITPVQLGPAQAGRLSRDELVQKYELVGRLHNEFLAFIHEEMRAAAQAGARGWKRDDYFRSAERSCRRFFKKHGFSEDACARFTEVSNGAASSGFTGTVAASFYLSNVEHYLGKIEGYAESYSNAAAYDAALANIESKAVLDTLLSPEDLEVIFAASSAARASAYHWETEYGSWEGLPGDQIPWDGPLPCPPEDPNCQYVFASFGLHLNIGSGGARGVGAAALGLAPAKCCWSNWRMVKADALGAVGGAIGGALVGGVGAVPGAIGGAAVGSGVELVSQLIDLLL